MAYKLALGENEMADEVVEQVVEPVVEVPSTTETLVEEAKDEHGVPWKNRVAEWQRKAEEAQATNQQYQQVLAAYTTQQAARPVTTEVPVDDPEEAQLDPVSRKLVYKIAEKVARKQAQEIAERTGYRFVAQAEHQNTLSGDPELYEEAKKQYSTFKSHPMWTAVDDTLIQNRAIAEARAVMAEKRKGVAVKTATQTANRAQAAVATVPVTQPGASPAPTSDKIKWVAAYVTQPETLQMFKMFEGHRYDPSNEQDRKKMTETAEEAWQGTKFTGATARAFQAFKSGAADEVFGGRIEEV